MNGAEVRKKIGRLRLTAFTQPCVVTIGAMVGWMSMQNTISSGQTKYDVKCAVASSFIYSGSGLRQTAGSSFKQVCTEPLAQRCCCDLKPFISTGSSAGV